MEAKMRILEMMAFVVLVQWATSFAWADEPSPDSSITQQQLTETTATSPPDGTPSTALPIHDLSKSEARALRQEGGVRVIKGDLWKSETLEQREQHLMNLKENAAPGTVFLIEAPSGNVWAFQVGPENAHLNEAIRDNIIHPWYPYQIMALPVSVANGGQPDRGGRNGFALNLQPGDKQP
jgi:hypothetical protein